ncbi:MAG: hypothetical protein ACOYM5_05730 [Caulobacter sp.]
MGGYFSGRHRTKSRGTVDEAQRLDLSRLRRLKFLKPDSLVRGPIYWTCRGERSGSITLTVDLTSLDGAHARLAYTAGGEAKVQVVQLVASPCRFGGHRYYWLCPVTMQRCTVLAYAGGRFASRQAQRLAYATQSADALDRLGRARDKAEARARGQGGHPRPRGANRERLLKRWAHLDTEWEYLFDATVTRRWGQFRRML